MAFIFRIYESRREVPSYNYSCFFCQKIEKKEEEEEIFFVDPDTQIINFPDEKAKNEKFIPIEKYFWEGMVIKEHPFSVKLNKITALYVTLFNTFYELTD